MQKRSGNRKTRMKKWAEVMNQLFANCGKEWTQLADNAKEQFARSIIANTHKINFDEMIWIKSIGEKINSYLTIPSPIMM
jgi:hypothetical protein